MVLQDFINLHLFSRSRNQSYLKLGFHLSRFFQDRGNHQEKKEAVVVEGVIKIGNICFCLF